MVGAAATVVFSLVAQIGEQVDYLRFLPPRTAANHRRWWASLLIAGPGWIVLGVAKMLGGALLAFLVLQHEFPLERAVEPTHMYLVAYQYVFDDHAWAVTFTAMFVVLSQIKINVTNAYAGSLAWSNFFSRLTHSHPGRVVWLVFNVLIALTLMELGVFAALESVLGIYANFATAWIGALVADLAINKPLGLSPRGIEFKRAHLYDINPVGLGATLIAAVVSIAAYAGTFGELLRAFSPFVALLTALTSAPLIAWATRGRYYLLRHSGSVGSRCSVCDNHFEAQDMATCPAYGGAICSLCCTLESRCHDMCKTLPESDHAGSWRELLVSFSRWSRRRVTGRVWRFLAVFLALAAVFGIVLAAVYYQAQHNPALDARWSQATFEETLVKLYTVVLLLLGVGVWWLVLTAESRDVAEDELNRHNMLLQKEVEDHQRTDAQLQKAKEAAESASLAKSRFLTDMSHELRSPLNTVLGYAQLLEADATLPQGRRDAARVIRESGAHILSMIDDILDIARIEARRLRLVKADFDIAGMLHGLVSMFKPQAQAKGLVFRLQIVGELPRTVKGDERRVRQVLINLLSNAVRYTQEGEVTLRVTYARELAHFVVADTGPGIAEHDLAQLFQPFFRGEAAPRAAPDGAGLGLVISKMLVGLMGGDLAVESRLGAGATFTLHVFLPEVLRETIPVASGMAIMAYRGPRRTVLVVDDQARHRGLIDDVLSRVGFRVWQACSGAECLRLAQLHCIDLVLMDLRMPGMDGARTTQALRQQGYKGPLFAVTAHALDEHRDEMMKAGADDFVAKPIDLDGLLTRIRVHLGLEWVYAEDAGAEQTAMIAPSAVDRMELTRLAEMGHVKAVDALLSDIEERAPQCRSFVNVARRFAEEFRLQDLARWVRNE
jgi:signal transduction histidine kinase/DNA-binding NarL/FixJ family response regulator